MLSSDFVEVAGADQCWEEVTKEARGGGRACRHEGRPNVEDHTSRRWIYRCEPYVSIARIRITRLLYNLQPQLRIQSYSKQFGSTLIILGQGGTVLQSNFVPTTACDSYFHHYKMRGGREREMGTMPGPLSTAASPPKAKVCNTRAVNT